jgi:hypothetical protein
MRQVELGEEISSSEIARLAGVKLPTVSNWRSRHNDFPAPVGGSETRPLFSREEVEAWLKANGKRPEGTGIEEIRRDFETMMAEGVPLAQALGAWHQLASGETAARMGVKPLPPLLTPAEMPVRGGLEAKYAELRDHLAPYPAPWPQVGRILAGHPSVTDQWAPLARTWAVTENVASGLIGLVLELAALKGGESVLDLAAGRSDFLRTVAKSDPTAQVRGFEPDPDAALRAQLHAAAAGVALELNIIDPFSAEGAAGAGAEIVFADGVWGRSLDLSRLAGDPRFPEPIGARQRDWAWAYLAISNLSADGRGFLTLPVSALGPGNAKAWRNLVLQGCIEAVIALPTGLYPGAHQSFQTCLLVLRKPAADLSTGVLMASTEKSPLGKNDPTVRQLAKDYQAWRHGKPGAPSDFWRAVQITTLAREKATLVPGRWLTPSPGDLTHEEIAGPVDAARSEVAQLLAGIPKKSPVGKLHRNRSGGDYVSVNDLILGRRIQIVASIPASASHSEFDKRADMTPVVSARSVDGFDFDGLFDTYSYVNAEERDRIGDDSLLARRGDVIVSPVVVRGRVRARAVAADDPHGFVSRSEIHLRVLSDDLDPDYVAVMLQSRWNAAFFTGTSSPKFNVRDLQIPQVSIEQQIEAVQGFEGLTGSRQQVEALAAALDRLREASIDAVATGRYGLS